MIELTKEDKIILSALHDDARLSLRDLGKLCNLSAPAVSNRIKRLEDNKVIVSYGLSINDTYTGLETHSVIYAKIRAQDEQRFVDYVKKDFKVSSCLKVTGDFNYLIKASFKSIKDLNLYVHELEKEFGQIKVEIILSEEFINRAPLDFDDLK